MHTQLQNCGFKVSYLLPQQFEDSFMKRKFKGIHDKNTRPTERTDSCKSVFTFTSSFHL